MPGLVLRVNYGGAKVWRALHYLKKLARTASPSPSRPPTSSGRYPHLKLKQARETARQFWRPAEGAGASRPRQLQGGRRELHQAPRRGTTKLRSQPEIERCPQKYIYPRWGARPFRDIKRGDVAALLDQVVDNTDPTSRCVSRDHPQDDELVCHPRPTTTMSARGEGDASQQRQRSQARAHPDDDEIRALWKLPTPWAPSALSSKCRSADRAAASTSSSLCSWDDIMATWTIATDRAKSRTPGLRLPPA